ncbi:TraB/GumN family protein [Piscinibacter sp. XHJ-5]|uniref:TraB/GumN family protein n=1 Tax=Piscinibacter sp. XHJ-5 TaxID=3037797 RepID=UPI002452E16B|nr:TraB/GumN family protein [Piscinibacter sp. XHJ-5]
MKRWFAFLLTFALAACAWGQAPIDCPPVAQPPTAQQLQAGMKTARDRGFLWRLSKDGRASYLYGTVHIARLEWTYPGPTLMAAVRASDLVALELDMLDPEVIERLRAGMAPRPQQALSGELAQRLKAQVRAACLPEQLVATLAPEMVATTLMVMAARHQGLDPAYAIDSAIAGWGRGLNKPVSSLETPELQLAILRGRSRDETQVLVEQVLAELESGRATPMLARIAEVWADGRFAELEDYEKWCQCLDTEEERAMHRRLLDDRNPAIAERIDQLHRGGRRVFAAVGSLHMIGPLGLPTLLRQRGYAVERVEFR